jgi:hypothetical protein
MTVTGSFRIQAWWRSSMETANSGCSAMPRARKPRIALWLRSSIQPESG